ncbi:MAG: TRAP transporter substrate-binding protein [Acidiferrobacterales bacterium]
MKAHKFSLAVLLAGVFVLAGNWAHAETLKLKMQTAVNAGAPHMTLLQRFADNVKQMSNGRVEIEILPAGAIVGAQQILDAVDKGLVPMGQAWTHYWTGKHPAAGLFSAPMSGAGTGLDQLGHLAWMMQGEGQGMLTHLYQEVIGANVVAFQIIPDGPEALGWFKKPLNTLDDFKKVKFRSPPGLPGEAYTEMGISVVSMPGPEILPAAERGVIDAGEWINPSADLSLGLHEVFKYYSLQGLHQAIDISDVIINRDVWRKMSPDLQAIIKVAAKASIIEALTYFIQQNSLALTKLTTRHGVTLFSPPKEYPEQFLVAANNALERRMKKDAFFNEVVQSMRGFSKDVVPYRIETIKQSLFMGEAGLKARK